MLLHVASLYNNLQFLTPFPSFSSPILRQLLVPNITSPLVHAYTLASNTKGSSYNLNNKISLKKLKLVSIYLGI